MLERCTQEQPPATPPAPSAGSIDVNIDLSRAAKNVRIVRSAAGECGERQRETAGRVRLLLLGLGALGAAVLVLPLLIGAVLATCPWMAGRAARRPGGHASGQSPRRRRRSSSGH